MNRKVVRGITLVANVPTSIPVSRNFLYTLNYKPPHIQNRNNKYVNKPLDDLYTTKLNYATSQSLHMYPGHHIKCYGNMLKGKWRIAIHILT